MYKKLWGVAVLGASFAAPAFAVTTDGHEIPYVAAQYAREFGDSSRDSKDGNGYQLTFGWPLANPTLAIEGFFYDVGRDRNIDGNKDYQSVIGADLVKDLGLFTWNGTYTKYLPSFKPFGLVGLEAVHEDVRGDTSWHPAANIGAGLLFPLPWYGAAVRTEGRAQVQSNDKSVQGENLPIDYRFTIGIQIPLTPLFKERTAPPAAPSCGVQVVALNGAPRTDCGDADSDKDGVVDSADKCPGTAEGLPVGPDGCPAAVGQPVPAPANPLSLKGVNFETASAKLTSASRPILDGAADALKAQPSDNAEVAGYTDSKGDPAYNLELSKQRAESVRQYLIKKGVDSARLTANGYGEANPVASNDTDEGREANRRVEIKLQAK
jgi:outer membrane protein OmpA-like peptidoglycan-associated protein